MTRLSKSKQPAPAPIIDDDKDDADSNYPSLAKPASSMSLEFTASSKGKKKNKKKNNNNQLTTNNNNHVTPVRKESLSLSSAADLISYEPVKKPAAAASQSKAATASAAAAASSNSDKKSSSHGGAEQGASTAAAGGPVEKPFKPSKSKADKMFLESTSELKKAAAATSAATASSTSSSKQLPIQGARAAAPATAEEDFPSLGPSDKKMSAHFRKIQLVAATPAPAPSAAAAKAPPPGFLSAGKGTTGASSLSRLGASKAPPPGFGVGQNQPSASNQRVSYIHPKNFGARNSALLESVTALMGGSKSSTFADFKTWSVQFRKDAISCSEYHDHCLKLVDIKNFEKFFPELLVLLPDIAKQQELYAVHVSKYPKSVLAVSPCGRCGQLVAKGEHMEDHKRAHLIDNDFPQLSI